MDSLLLYKIIFLSSALGSLIIALVVSFKNIKTRLNLFFVLINLSAVIWAVGRYALLVVQDINLAFSRKGFLSMPDGVRRVLTPIWWTIE